MKKLLLIPLLLFFSLPAKAQFSPGGANPRLSNLGTVAVNAPLNPGTDNSINLTDASHRYIDAHFSGTVYANSLSILCGGSALTHALLIFEGTGTCSSIPSPTANGTYQVIFPVVAGVAVDPTTGLPGTPCRVVTTTPDPLLYSDRGGCIIYRTGASVATIPVANSAGFTSNFPVKLIVEAGPITFNITTSTANIVTGIAPVIITASTFTMQTGQWSIMNSPDNTNYEVTMVTAGASGSVALCSTQYGIGEWFTTGTTISCNANIISDASNNLHVGGKLLDLNGGYAAWGGTPGTSGLFQAGIEGTAPTFKSAWDEMWFDSTFHDLASSANGGNPRLMLTTAPSPIHQTAKTSAITTATLCSTSAGNCDQAGQYHIHWDFTETGTACSSVIAGGVTFLLTWTDTNGTAHSAISLPMFDSASITGTSGTFHFATALGTAWASGDFNVSTNGSIIQYATGYTACTTGTGTYQLDIAVTRLQ